MRISYSYLQKETAQRFPFFVKSKKDETRYHNIVSQKNFSILTILKILSVLIRGETQSTQLYYHSGIRMKRSYLNYLHLVREFGFVNRRTDGNKVFYSINDKGRTLLRLFEK